MAFTTVTANKILNKVIKGTDFTPASTLYLALYTADPGEAGTSNEVSGGSYARQAVTFGTVATKAVSNSATIDFASMPAATVTHVGLWSAASGGDFWWGGALAASKTTTAGDTLRVNTGDLDVTLT